MFWAENPWQKKFFQNVNEHEYAANLREKRGARRNISLTHGEEVAFAYFSLTLGLENQDKV